MQKYLSNSCKKTKSGESQRDDDCLWWPSSSQQQNSDTQDVKENDILKTPGSEIKELN